MNKDNKREFIKVPYEYGLRRFGQRGFYLSFDNIEDLRAELSRYFTPRELDSGIVDRLTTFDVNRMQDDMVKNSYQNFDISCFYEDKEVLIYDRETADREKKLGVFDVSSPQECADLFGKPVKDGEKIYFPQSVHKALDEKIKSANDFKKPSLADVVKAASLQVSESVLSSDKTLSEPEI